MDRIRIRNDRFSRLAVFLPRVFAVGPIADTRDRPRDHRRILSPGLVGARLAPLGLAGKVFGVHSPFHEDKRERGASAWHPRMRKG
jgi:hypothetical protein